MTPWLNNFLKIKYEIGATKKSIFFPREGIFFLKYFLVDKLTNAKRNFLASYLLSKKRSEIDFWLWRSLRNSVDMTFLKISICFIILRGLISIFIRKVRSPTNTDISSCGNDKTSKNMPVYLPLLTVRLVTIEKTGVLTFNFSTGILSLALGNR